MKKSIILKFGLVALIYLQGIISYSQNLNLDTLIPNNNNEKADYLSGAFPKSTAKPAKLTGGHYTNPAIEYVLPPYLGTISICPNDGQQLPKLFLCGNYDTRLIKSDIDAYSVTWYKFNSGSCPPAANNDCPNDSAPASCWSIVGQGPDYLVDTEGQFKVVIVDYTFTPCTFYFNAYKTNLDNAVITKSDIVTYSSGGINSCSIDGRITVDGFGSGYEYNFTQDARADISNVWQDSNVFKTSIGGTYNIFMRVKGLPGACTFNIGSEKLIQYINKDLAFKFYPYNPKCYGEAGTLVTEVVGTDNPNIPFEYKLYDANDNEIYYYGPTFEAKYVWPKLYSQNGSTGGKDKYKSTVTTSYSKCFNYSYEAEINFQPPVKVSYTITEPLMPCSDGKVSINAAGGTGSGYTYNISSADGRFTSVGNTIKILAPGTYKVEVEDAFSCSATASIVIPPVLKPEYTIDKTDNVCYGNNTGSIKINVTNANGYELSYSKDNGQTFQISNTFSYLASGTYDVVVKYNIGKSSCQDLKKITIDGPTSALTAIAKITGLSGCGPKGKESQGVVTIANPQGGVPFPAPNLYLYSFDGGKTWQTSNVAFINPGGPYTFYIKDATGCIYPMSEIYLAPKPPAPVVTIDPVYNCNGNATITVNIQGEAPDYVYSYQYYIDGVLNTNNTNPNVFLDVVPGPHKITVDYKETSALFPDAVSCGTKMDYSIPIDATKAFSATVINPINVKCSLGTDGGFTITAKNFDAVYGFDYSLDDGLTWINSKLSPVIITDKKEGIYKIKVRYNNGADGCLSSFTQELKAPASLEISKVIIVTPATCRTGATIQVMTSGGTPAYQYQLLDGTTFTVIKDFQNSNIFSDVKPGSYIVVVKDKNGCQSQNATINIVIPAPDLPVATIDSKGTCFNGTKATITVNITGGVAPYTYQVKYNSGALSPSVPITGSSFTYDGTAIGDYTFVITDSYGCQTTAVTQTINAKLAATVKTITSLTCESSSTATIEVTIKGGTAPFTYIVKKGSKILYTSEPIAGPQFTYNTDSSGTYTFVINDKNSCPITVTGIVNDITNPIVSAAVTPITCNSLSNGSVVLTGSGGSGDYMFSDNAVTGFTKSPNFSNLSLGSHTFYVKDSNGCMGQTTIDIKQPDLIKASASIKTPYTCETNAEIIAIADGGNGKFTYVLSVTINGITTVVATNDTGIFSGLTVAGEYTVSITDTKGCSPSPAVIDVGAIYDLTEPSAMLIKNTELKCPSNLVDVTIEMVTGGKAPLEYAITAPAALVRPYQESNLFKDLAPGTYTFIVRDANKCTFTTVYTIAKLPVINLTSSVVNNVKCIGESNGSIKFTISGLGNDTPYSYIFDGGTPQSGVTPHTGTTFDLIFTNLNAGEHSLTIKNEITNCELTKKENVLAPPSALTIVSTVVKPVTCKDKGSAVINVKGGWGGNVYTIITPGGITIEQTNKTFKNLDAGNYTFSVTDFNGCTNNTGAFTIDTNQTIDAEIVPIANLCFDTTGATINVIPNTKTNYTYSLNGGTPQDNGTFTELTPGKYTVRVTDTSTGCYKDLDMQTVIDPLTASINLQSGPKCTSASIEIAGKVSGGSPNYSYTVAINGDTNLDPTIYTITGNTFTYVNEVAVTATTATTYSFTIKDATGCSTTLTEIVQPKTDPEITSVLPSGTVKCNGGTTGSIEVVINPTKGMGPYVINVTKLGIPEVDYGTKTTGLPAGNYIVKVTDANGCFTKAPVEIIQPNPLVIDFDKKDLKCEDGGVAQGQIIINSVSGGTKNYDYYVTGPNGYSQHIPNVPGTMKVFDVDFGLYQIKVVDNNSCDVEVANVLIAAPVNYLDIDIVTTSTCADGSATVTIGSKFPSTGPFHFNIYKGTGQVWTADGIDGWQGELPFGSKTTTFTSLTPGVIYSFIVYDETTKCYYYQTAEMPIPSKSSLKLDEIVIKNITCKDSNDGNVSFAISNGYDTSVDVSYQIYESLSNLPIAGTLGTQTIAAGATLHVDNLGIGVLPVGSYYVLVRETSGPNTGCGVPTASFNIKESAVMLSVTASVTKNANCNSGAGIIEVFAQGGTTISASPGVRAVPYLYQIFPTGSPVPSADSFLVGSHTSNTFNVDAGNYIVYVRDAYGCVKSTNVTVTLDPAPVIKAEVGNQCTATEGKFSIDVDLITAGIGQHTYSFDNGAFKPISTMSFTITNVSSGSHTVRVKDANNCVDEVAVQILTPLQIVASFTTLPNCEAKDGIITAIAIGGSVTGNYQFTLQNNTVVGVPNIVQDNGVFNNIAAGNYTVTVKDLDTNCEKSSMIDIEVRTAIDFTLESTSPSCAIEQGNVSDGTIEVKLVNTDNSLYTYILTPTEPAGASKTQDTPLFTGLTAGLYSIKVISDKGCDDTKTIRIDDASPITATLLQDDFKCNGNDLKAKEITILPNGGNGTGAISDYVYSNDGVKWGPTNTFEVIDNKTIQVLTYYVKDSKDCIGSNTITIDPFPKLTAPEVIFGPSIDCENGKQEINVTIKGGTNTPNPFSYLVYQDGELITEKIPVTGNKFTYDALTAGSYYQFEIFDNNTNCSIMSDPYEVQLFNKLKVVATSTDVGCNGDSTGTITINVKGYSGAYTYEVFDGLNFVVRGEGDTTLGATLASELRAGKNYTVVVKESGYPQCSQTSNTVIIAEPLLPLSLSNDITIVNQNCNTLGTTVTVPITSVTGGTPDYSYAFVQEGTSPSGLYSDSNIATLDPELNTKWDVWVMDKNKCTAKTGITIAKDPIPSAITATPHSQCYDPDTDTYSISVTASGVEPLQYGLDKENFTTNNVLTVNSPGTYDVYVKDANGCISKAEDAFTILDMLELSGEITTYPKCNGNEGVVTLKASGGTVAPTNYQYSLETGAFGDSNEFKNLGPGTYRFWVKDVTTGCTKDFDIEIPTANLIPSILLTYTATSCNEASDGTVTVAIDGNADSAHYKYSLTGDKGLQRGLQESAVFENLPADNYTVMVISDRGCEAEEQVKVTEPNAINVEVVDITQFGCEGSNSPNVATINVNATGGSENFTIYEFTKIGSPNKIVQADNRNKYIETDYDGGSYLVKVYDDKNCEGTAEVPITINPYIGLDKIEVDVLKSIPCMNNEDVQVKVKTTDGTIITVPLTYSITGIDSTVYNDTNTDGLFTGLTIGNYLVSVKNPATDCVLETFYFVKDSNTFELQVSNVGNIQCYGGDDGSVNLNLTDRQIIPTNNTLEFTYLINDDLGSQVASGKSKTDGTAAITGLKAGNYTVTATLVDKPFCSVENTFTIGEPIAKLQIEEIHNLITCNPGNDGIITVKGSGGWPGNYEYALDGPIKVAYSEQYEFIGLTAGIYTVSVKDSRGCVATTAVTLKNPDPISVVATASTLLCFGDENGEIEVTATGGLENNYYYVLNMLSVDPPISTIGQTIPFFKGLSAGVYSVTVTDGLDCVGTSSDIVIAQPTEIVATLKLETRKTCQTSATLTLSAKGGTGMYEYSNDPTFTTTIGSFTSSITFEASLGDHQYYVRDANRCVAFVSNTVTVSEVAPLSLELNLNGAIVYCKGDISASIDAIALGGLGNYKYTLINDEGDIVRSPQIDTYFGSLSAGKYKVRVNSGDCQFDSDLITINEPIEALTASSVVTDATCNSENDGKIVITASGGTGKIKYAISPNLSQFEDNNTFNHLAAGVYTILVQDQFSCFKILECEIKEPVVLTAKVIGPILQETCDGNNDGAFSIAIIGGTPPYSVSLDDKFGVYVPVSGAQHDFVNLKGDNHTVYIKDAGCLIEMVVMMDKAVILQPKSKINTECANNAVQNSVTITVDKSNTNLADIDYSLDGAAFQISNVFTNITPGTHTVTARHTNGCEQTTLPFTIDEVQPLTLSLTDGHINEIIATATGGGGDYQYTLDGESYGSLNKLIIYKTGTYTITVTDKNGCTATLSKYMEYIDICIPDNFTPNGDGINDTWGPGCTINYKDLVYEIFDRYGRVIAKYRYGQKWDGKYNGIDLPSGDYWYVLKLNNNKDNREFVGHFTLYR
ncbi:T9SS type B sorting domain-containing protein [Flavobacterium sp. LPB0248]|uniref:T9SS type B sorting domain-containing protein n=1 Tax=Flavobacterium sp. LPB0248 TaxID=2614441 RepID=UPI0015A5024A|nr:T9SS type B sorting domain-containing protein [Flavobacterium sp. LPB0248]QLC66335.1 T9SS type B sorting domain-containing protein [Flavobacterium sp. LPB0248]